MERWIEELPSGLVACSVGGREVTILRFSPVHAVLRLPKEGTVSSPVVFSFFQREKSGYQEVAVFPTALSRTDAPYWQEVMLTIQAPEYTRLAEAAIHDYNRFALLRLYGGLAQERSGYPEELDEVITPCFSAQKESWFQALSWEDCKLLPFELSLSLSNPKEYRRYLAHPMETLFPKLLEENHLTRHPVTRQLPTRLHLGSSDCRHLLPDGAQWNALLNKAHSEGLSVTVAIPPLSDGDLDWGAGLLVQLNRWCVDSGCSLELAVNDWGTAVLAESYPHLLPVPGSLLVKEQRDPRLEYLSRKEAAEVLPTVPLPELFHSAVPALSFPWSRTNTSLFCPLAALCATGDRGRQQDLKDCPRYCRQAVLSYPDHLHMVGRYHSLFALNTRLWERPKEINRYLSGGVGRIVLELL